MEREPYAHAESANGILRVFATFPLPAWDKNSRLVPNCIRRESAAEGGRLYYKPGVGLWKLGPLGLAYRGMVSKVLGDALPRKPYFVSGMRWGINFEQYGPGDVDHYLAGILDDMCWSGLAKSDRDCKRRVVDVWDEDNVMQQRIELEAWQEIG